jgi:hypothetical protein
MLIVLLQSLLKLMRDANGNLSYRAVQKNELDACEESLFLPDASLLIFALEKKG